MEKEFAAAQELVNTLIQFCVNYSFQIIGAFLVLIIGNWIAGRISELLLKVFERKKMDVTLARFLANAVKIIILAFVIIIALGKFGITIAPFIAALGAVAFGASLAIQGPLSNYGAGLSIIISRPFVVGNTIVVAGVSGVVEEVKLAATILTNEDGVRITIPNKHIVGEVLHNSFGNKIVDAAIGISYESDPGRAIEIIMDVLNKTPEVSQDPVPQVGIRDFGDSSINIGYRYWIPTVKYFKISYAVNRSIFKAFQAGGITIPFPQREIRILQEKSRDADLKAKVS